MKKVKGLVVVAVFGLAFVTSYSWADTPTDNCPVSLVTGKTLDEEFGPGTADLTRCLRNTKKVKVVYQVNVACKNATCTAPYALGNIKNAIRDYEITHGMTRGKDYEIAAVVHSGGTELVLNNNALNPNAITNRFQAQMEEIIGMGVKVYYCQNTARKKSVSTDQLIGGVGYVTSGVTAIPDFQMKGYAYVQP